jgi:hypothetical protein
MKQLMDVLVAGFLIGVDLDTRSQLSFTPKRLPFQSSSALLLGGASTFAASSMRFIALSTTRKPDNSESTASNEGSANNGGVPRQPQQRTKEEEDALLGYAIDSFLRGDYNLQLPQDKVTPVPPDANPGMIVSTALSSLRGKDLPSQAHGAAIFLRYCMPLRRSERWGDASSIGKDPWKEVLRGASTANSLVQRVRASDFAALLDWSRMDVTEGAFTSDRDLVGLPSVAYVNAALFFEENSEPVLFQFKLQRIGGGTWMIDTIRRSQKELFLETDPKRPRKI